MATLPIAGASIPYEGARAWLAPRSEGHRLHAGVDLSAGASTPILAPSAGRVVLTFESSRPTERARSVPAGWSGYGPHGIIIQGDDGWVHLLAHVGRPSVRRGERVTEGQVLAHGSALGHVHWEVRTRVRRPAGVATVEISADPASWYTGAPIVWGEGGTAEHWPGPPLPTSDERTPRRHRPGWVGPAPLPFPHPRPPAAGNV